MTSFSTILSSINQKLEAPQTSSNAHDGATAKNSVDRSLQSSARYRLTPTSSVAGVKRKLNEPDSGGSNKSAAPIAPQLNKTSPSSSRYQLSMKSKTTQQPPVSIPVRGSATLAKTGRSLQEHSSTSGSRNTSHGINNNLSPAKAHAATSASTAAPKKGFASILEKAKAAQAASQTTSAGGIKHKPIERIPRKERQRMVEEAKNQQKSAERDARSNKGQLVTKASDRNAKPLSSDASYRGTMKKAPAPAPESSYKGTMRKVAPGAAPQKPKQKGLAQDKYGGYASWSDLDDAEDDEEEEGYDTYESDDMEGGFDDLQNEEAAALRAARMEDQAALEEEERHRQEKLARKRKLEQMNKAAAAKKRY